MPVCCVSYCKNRSSNKSMRQQLEEKKSRITFHKLPKDNDRRSVWEKAISRIDWTPTNASVICSAHFTEECFDKTSLAVIRIRDTAVPTIFPSNAPRQNLFINYQ